MESAAQVANIGYRIYLIPMLPFMVLIEVIFAYDFVQQLRAVPMNYTYVFIEIVALLVLGLIIIIVSRDALKVAAAIKYYIKK